MVALKLKTKLETALSTTLGVFLVIALLSIVINLLMLTAPIYMLQVYDRILTTGHVETLVLLTIVAAAALLLMCGLDRMRSSIAVRTGCWIHRFVGPTVIACGVRAELEGVPGATQRLQDMSKIQGFLASPGLFAFFDSPWVPVFAGIIWLMHPALGVIAVGTALTLLMLSVIIEFVTRTPLSKADGFQSSAMRQADFAIRNAGVVQAMGMIPALVQRWDASNAATLDELRQSGDRSSILLALTKFVRMFSQILILGVGAWLVINGDLTAGGMIAASILLGRALAPAEQAIGAWRQFTEARQSYLRVNNYLTSHPLEPERTSLPTPSGHLCAENLTYLSKTRYPILRSVSFNVAPGEAVAVIGSSGAGKSTLCRLLVGLNLPNFGEVRLDGTPLSLWNSVELGRHIGYLPQDVELFEGTVRDNIARMTQADDESVIRAARLAEAHEMIMRLPEGYETVIGPGRQLSGGQRQRVGLARAVFGDPRLIVLDEPNANLDTVGESSLAAAVEHMKGQGACIIIVGHRPSTLAEADKVLLMRDGHVACFGPRDEVLEKLRPVPGGREEDREEDGADKEKRRASQ